MAKIPLYSRKLSPGETTRQQQADQAEWDAQDDREEDFIDQSIFQGWFEFESPRGRLRAEDKGSYWQMYEGVDLEQGGAYTFFAIDQLPATAADTPESLYKQLIGCGTKLLSHQRCRPTTEEK